MTGIDPWRLADLAAAIHDKGYDTNLNTGEITKRDERDDKEN